ncbi:Flp family type IVb pilin [Sphingomonas pseudosanguinis]|uniref:Flp pilus assembly pilin Flp n=1 Tax=Sphingomonas pseudosanguinis TaxID=413712 RepID=A0A7W6A9W7_9SPHN|nr:Flp family type IVb pilin [Sphingomonas pseudosanguinis]MBB3878574.1 Flp pilus assembly pilin Flp [Sphingomonas pseudosanguinis]MBN3536173.1 Flp family type IVb pilin [Sphingomonas pseudosanguinis]
MNMLTILFKRLHGVATDRRGATVVEYGLVIACIMLGIFAVLSQIGVNLAGVLSYLGDRLGAALR